MKKVLVQTGTHKTRNPDKVDHEAWLNEEGVVTTMCGAGAAKQNYLVIKEIPEDAVWWGTCHRCNRVAG